MPDQDPVRRTRVGRAALVATAALVFTLGCGDTKRDDGSVDGVERVTLTGNYLTSLTGQGWNLESGRITNEPADVDFALSMTMVIMLHPRQPEVGFCEPGGVSKFERVEDVPSDASGCTGWGSADLGGNSPVIADSVAGRGFIVRNRDAVPVAKLMIVSASVVEADVQVTFDIAKL